MKIHDAINGRISVRSFLNKPIEKEKINRVLDISRRAPSWKNIQAYKIAVVQGNKKEKLKNLFIQAIEEGKEEKPDYPYQTTYPSYIKKRMLELGASYFEHMGIDRKDKEKRNESMLLNFKFFGAPTVLFFFMEKDMGYWPTLDLGILLGTLMLAAREEGLETIAQGSLTVFPDLVRKELEISDNFNLAVGLSIGYADLNEHINQFYSKRAEQTEIVRFYE